MDSKCKVRLDQMYKATRDVSISRLSQFIKPEITPVLREHSGFFENNNAAINKISAIIMANTSMRAIFRVLFNTTALSKTLKFEGKSAEPDSNAIPAMREYCNLVGGRFIQIIEQKGYPMGLSIPIDSNMTRFYDTLFVQDSRTISKAWTIDLSNTAVHILFSIEVENENQIIDMNFDTGPEVENDEVEFF